MPWQTFWRGELRRSGKTAAFGIPAVEKVDVSIRATQILILCPTRELAVQVSEEIHKLAHKGKKAVCHSDVVKDAEEAKLVQISTLKAHGVVVNEVGL